MQNVALITGASSGIGKELAYLHASKGGDVVLTARRGPLLEAIRRDLVEKFNVQVRVFEGDLSAEGAGIQLAETIASEGIQIEYLINNAGFGGHGEFHTQPLERYHDMIAVNITALTDLTHAILPGMLERGSGRIMQVGSIAGFIPGPLQAVYYASKAYVLSLSEALAEELRDTPITVTCLSPGPVSTGFSKVAGTENTRNSHKSLSAEVVAKVGYQAMMAGKVIAVPGFKMRFIAGVLTRLYSRKTIRKLSREAQEMKK